MDQRFKLIAIVGFLQLFAFTIFHQQINTEPINAFGKNAFKVGFKTAIINDIDGLVITSDQFYKDVFEQPDAYFFVVEEDSLDGPQLILSGTPINIDAYENFEAIEKYYTMDSTLVVLSSRQTENNLELFFADQSDTSITYRVKFYKSYPYYFQLFAYWYGNKHDEPDYVQTAFNSFTLK